MGVRSRVVRHVRCTRGVVSGAQAEDGLVDLGRGALKVSTCGRSALGSVGRFEAPEIHDATTLHVWSCSSLLTGAEYRCWIGPKAIALRPQMWLCGMHTIVPLLRRDDPIRWELFSGTGKIDVIASSVETPRFGYLQASNPTYSAAMHS